MDSEDADSLESLAVNLFLVGCFFYPGNLVNFYPQEWLSLYYYNIFPQARRGSGRLIVEEFLLCIYPVTYAHHFEKIRE